MLSEKVEKALNAQINAEFWSAYLYLSMSADAMQKGYKGIANWFSIQFQEEQAHAQIFVNYVLSLTFVFRRKDNRGSGKSVAAFLIFTVVGVIGLGLTELIMYLGTELLHISYLIVKIAAAAIVLVWNYVGRKVLIFDRKGKIETK